MEKMTFDEFVEKVAVRLENAGNRPMQDGPAIEATISWAASQIRSSPDWQEKDVREFISAVGKRLGAVDEIDPRTGHRLKRAQSNAAFLALMARADLLIQSTKGAK